MLVILNLVFTLFIAYIYYLVGQNVSNRKKCKDLAIFIQDIKFSKRLNSLNKLEILTLLDKNLLKRKELKIKYTKKIPCEGKEKIANL